MTQTTETQPLSDRIAVLQAQADALAIEYSNLTRQIAGLELAKLQRDRVELQLAEHAGALTVLRQIQGKQNAKEA